MQDHLSQSGVRWVRLDDGAQWAAEDRFRSVYGQAFLGRSRLRQGTKADYEYEQLSCTDYLIVPFSSNVPGLPLHVDDQTMSAYECHGPLVPVGDFADVEFFVCPIDLSWAMIHTHEDHAFGGPYFIRADWLAGTCG